MNIKKTILYLLLSIFSLIFAYNYLLAPTFYNNNTGRGMGMMGTHMNGNTNYYYNNNGNFAYIIIIIIFIIISLIVVDNIFSKSGASSCRKCGMQIESDKWRVCPRCGSKLNRGE